MRSVYSVHMVSVRRSESRGASRARRRMPTLLVLFPILLFAFIPATLSAANLDYIVSLSENDVTLVASGNLSRVRVAGEGFEMVRDAGRPVLPCRIVSFILPPGDRVDGYSFTPGAEKTIARGVTIPAASPYSTIDGLVGKGTPLFAGSSEGDVYPPANGIYLGTGFLHGYSIASFAVYPLRLSNGDLNLNETVKVAVTTAPAAGEAPVSRRRHDSDFQEKIDGILATLVVNTGATNSYGGDRIAVEMPKGGFSPTMSPSIEGSPVDYLIITTEELSSEFERLADWKTSKGVPTVVRSVEWIAENCINGVDLAETIRFFIRDAYEKWGIEFVLLGGDTDVIPVRYGLTRYLGEGVKIPADMYFACLDGSWNSNNDEYWGEHGADFDDPDLYAEVHVGRVPTSTLVDAVTIIDKVIAYETPMDTEYTDKVLFGAEVLFPPDWVEGEPMALNGADISEMTWVLFMDDKPIRGTRAYETYEIFPGAVDLTRQIMIDSLDSGFNMVNHVGHGSRFNFSCADQSVIQSDIDALTNGDRLFTIFMVDCKVSAFDYQCITENMLTNPNGGAVATVGASHLEFPACDSHYMNAYYDLAFNHNVVRGGETLTFSRAARTPWAESADNVDLWTHYVYTLLGDPEMPMWTGAVKHPNVYHATNVALGNTNLVVAVTSDGLPVDSAFVCLRKDGDDYQYGATDAMGGITFDFSADTPGEISVVVTGLNLVRYQGTITVDPTLGAHVSLSSAAVDDDTTGGTFGNGDGVIDAGETVDFALELKNAGGTPSGSVTATLRCDDADVIVVDSTASFGVIGAGTAAAATDSIRVTFNSAIEDARSIQFDLVIENNGLPKWEDILQREVHAPDLALTTLRISDDAPYGNGNGINENNEEFLLFYKLKNYGTGTAFGLTAVVTDLSGRVIVHEGTAGYPDLAPFTGGENSAGFHLEESDTAVENNIVVEVTDLFGRAYVDTIELRAPYPPSNLVFDAGLGVDRIKTYWSKSPSPDVSRYQVYRSLGEGGPYDLVSVDPLEHTVFIDPGLSASTRYYYVVTAVDSSGNESAPSTEYSVSTNPPQLVGWPLEVDVSTTSPTVVGDIDGDGDLELVAGSAHICAWHHDGQEVLDGDSDPQTWGVLAEVGAQFNAAIALANLDNVPGLDIIAADLNTDQVYCVSHDGNLLPGWPQTAENEFRAAPVAGDLNGDGFYEVIAVDIRGVVYAWNSDGTEYRDGDDNPATHGVFSRTPATIFHYQTPTLCDIDGDFKDDIVLGTRVDSIYVFSGDSTGCVAGWPFAMDGESAGSIIAGDADGDGEIELLAQSKGSYGRVYLLNCDGTVVDGWPRTVALRDIFFTSSPAFADFNYDGTLEAVVYGWNSFESRLYIFDHEGNDYPGWPVIVSEDYSEASPVVGDLDGDGVPEIVFGDESRFIRAFNILGDEIDGFPVTTQDAIRGAPFITDLDEDGDVDLVAMGWDRGVYVWDLDGTYDSGSVPWPAYQSNVHRNGVAGFEVMTAVRDIPDDFVTEDTGLLQNYPNPFNPVTTIVFNISGNSVAGVRLGIYDVTGALVRVLVDEELPAGRYERRWDGHDRPWEYGGDGNLFLQVGGRRNCGNKKNAFIEIIDY